VPRHLKAVDVHTLGIQLLPQPFFAKDALNHG
jgi:hypothetical protein